MRKLGSRVEIVALADLQKGPIRHTLTAAQEARIQAFTETFLDVFPVTLEEAFDGFRRDMHPDREIEIWERMAGVYKRHVGKCPTLAEKKALFGLLLSGGEQTGQAPS